MRLPKHTSPRVRSGASRSISRHIRSTEKDGKRAERRDGCGQERGSLRYVISDYPVKYSHQQVGASGGEQGRGALQDGLELSFSPACFPLSPRNGDTPSKGCCTSFTRSIDLRASTCLFRAYSAMKNRKARSIE